jgi:predicted DNA binding CopG/RHH family protein
LLAALAAPAPAWNDDDLADDVATLSYERALRTHTRYQHPNPTDRSLLQPAEPRPLNGAEYPPNRSSVEPAAMPRNAQSPTADPQPKAAFVTPAALERDLKSASVTIRLSQAENAQLRQRAAQAGLTISDYLRSCTFEAESLRALVKDTLAQLRANPPNPDRSGAKNMPPNPDRRSLPRGSRPRRSWLEWFRSLLPPWHSHRPAVRA